MVESRVKSMRVAEKRWEKLLGEKVGSKGAYRWKEFLVISGHRTWPSKASSWASQKEHQRLYQGSSSLSIKWIVILFNWYIIYKVLGYAVMCQYVGILFSGQARVIISVLITSNVHCSLVIHSLKFWELKDNQFTLRWRHAYQAREGSLKYIASAVCFPKQNGVMLWWTHGP